MTFACMTNSRPTEKLPEYGDCLFALQTNTVKGTTGPFWNLQPCYATVENFS